MSRHPDPENRAIEQRLAANMEAVTHKIIVMSGKGGVGKSSVAVNLACGLRQAGHSVGIMDTDIHGPNIAKMLGVEERSIIKTDWGLQPVECANGLKAVSMALTGMHADQPLIWRGPMKYSAIREFLADVMWGKLDYLIIDSPPGTGDEPLTVAQLIKPLTGAVIVSTPQDVAILDSRKTVFFARSLKIPVLGIVENMSGFACPHCHHDIDLFKTGGAERAAAELRVPFLGRIPFDPRLVVCGDSGRPFIESVPDSPAASALTAIVSGIEKTCRELNEYNQATHNPFRTGS